jgi:hypothetical protein
MFNRLAGLLSRIRPRRKTLTEDERLSRDEARLQALQDREDRDLKNKSFSPQG